MAVVNGDKTTDADRAWAAQATSSAGQTDSSTGPRRHRPHRMVLHRRRRPKLPHPDRARSNNGALHCDFHAALLGSDQHLELNAAETQVFHLPDNDS
jgi:hypothetical protein